MFSVQIKLNKSLKNLDSTALIHSLDNNRTVTSRLDSVLTLVSRAKNLVIYCNFQIKIFHGLN